MWIFWVLGVVVFWQNVQSAATGSGFSCEGRASGYYADIDSGCQVYHMCDGLGRQFSYSCPNTTLFQQRMLICDHWYMVNCSKSELDYGANLLIGQRDKPFVDDSSENPYHRTPRPDLETHPYAPRFQNDYRQGRAQIPTNLNLVGIETENENSTTDGPQYFLPSHWSTQYSKGSTTPLPFNKKYGKTGTDKVTSPLFRNDPKLVKTTKTTANFKGVEKKEVSVPPRFTLPPFAPKATSIATQKVRQFTNEQAFQGFGSSTSPTIILPPRVDQLEVSGLSKVLQPPKLTAIAPQITPQLSAFKSFGTESSRRPSTTDAQFSNTFKTSNAPTTLSSGAFKPLGTPRETSVPFKPTAVDINVLKPPQPSSFATTKSNGIPSKSTNLLTNSPVTIKPPQISRFTNPSSIPVVTNEIEPPSIYYQPPKLTAFFEAESTTMDPITFYKLVPSKNLQPPKIKSRSDDERTIVEVTTLRSVTKKDTTKLETTPGKLEVRTDEKKWKDLRQMFFIPEYDFPLDLGFRPSYDSGVSSFQVKQSPLNPAIRPKDESQETKCDPKCDPAFLKPGTCKPCVMIRR